MTNQELQHQVNPEDPEPRWPALISLLAVAGLYEALPSSLYLGPRDLLAGLVVALLIPTVATRLRGKHGISRVFSLTVVGIVTIYLFASVILLVHATVLGHMHATHLLLSASVLWLTNVLVFALWYWNLDAGGPHQRDLRNRHEDGAFLFPQMTMSSQAKEKAGEQDWDPNFVDYLFLAFNTSTALSPADTAVLSRWAKVMCMIQALISLTVVALLAGRAVNILPGS
jgi:hypothetical protein